MSLRNTENCIFHTGSWKDVTVNYCTMTDTRCQWGKNRKKQLQPEWNFRNMLKSSGHSAWHTYQGLKLANQIKTKNNSPLESSTLGWAAGMALLRKPVWCLAQSIAMAITKWREGFPDWKEENIPEWRQWNLRREAEASQKQNRAKWKIFLFWLKTLKTELICWFHSLSSNVNVSRLNVLSTAKENSL